MKLHKSFAELGTVLVYLMRHLGFEDSVPFLGSPCITWSVRSVPPSDREAEDLPLKGQSFKGELSRAREGGGSWRVLRPVLLYGQTRLELNCRSLIPH